MKNILVDEMRSFNDFNLALASTDWYDDYLYRTGAMNSRDIQFIAEDFKSVGFEISRKNLTETMNGLMHVYIACCQINPSVHGLQLVKIQMEERLLTSMEQKWAQQLGEEICESAICKSM